MPGWRQTLANRQQSIRKQKGLAGGQAFRARIGDSGASRFSLDRVLETDFGGDLEPSGAAAAEEGIADADVAGGR